MKCIICNIHRLFPVSDCNTDFKIPHCQPGKVECTYDGIECILCEDNYYYSGDHNTGCLGRFTLFYYFFLYNKTDERYKVFFLPWTLIMLMSISVNI